MPNIPIDVTVGRIAISPANTVVGVKIGEDVHDAFVLEYDHPGYSSIYTLLMASAVNKKPIGVYSYEKNGGPPIIEGVVLKF